MRLSIDPTSPSGLSPIRDTSLVGISTGGGSSSGVQSVIAGTNITVTGDPTNPTINATTGGGGSGITHNSLASRTITTTATGGSTALIDYIYYLSTGAVYTQPTAVGNLNTYSLKNITTSSITVLFTSGQTADGSTTLVLAPNAQVTLSSDNSNWQIGA